MLLADQVSAAEFSGFMSGPFWGWVIFFACIIGIIVGAAGINWKAIAPTWKPPVVVIPNNPFPPKVKPVAPIKPADDVTLTDKAKEFVVEREQSATEKAALIEAKAKAMAEYDALIAANDADRRNAESLIIVGEAQP